MLTYEKAKELKDAGFPQSDWNYLACQHRTPQSLDEEAHHMLNKETCDIVSLPTLSELIEACGDNFGSLDKTEEGWAVIPARHVLKNHQKEMKQGWILDRKLSPEEAVANLYLALNKK